DTVSDPRGVRRPTPVSALAAISDASEEDVIRVVEVFRRGGRCFLMPPASVPLAGRSIVDISHESLMRCWGRLIAWAAEERASAAFYVRLSQAAAWFEEGSAGVWRNPELELARRWRTENEPSPAWAARYDAGFDRAMAFLDHSLAERDRALAAVEHERRAKLRRTQLVAGVLATLLAVAAALGVLAWRERQRAQGNLELARRAVDESLAAADRDPAQIGADVPQVQELRRELLAKAETFYRAFMNQEPRDDESRRDVAGAHLRLGHINRMLEHQADAERHYGEAIARLAALVSENPEAAEDRQSLAAAYNWLGETLRRQGAAGEQAAQAYGSALELQERLVRDHPTRPAYREELARTLSNRGILRFGAGGDVAAAERDLREAIRLLEPLSESSARALQDLGRAANNLAALLDSLARDDARAFYERAVAAHERLVERHPDNTEYKLELATFANNLAVFLYEHDASAEAVRHSRRALELLTALARPAPSLAIERADAHNLRGWILQEQNVEQALQAYEAALDHFRDLGTDPAVTRMPMFHVRFGDLLVNLAVLATGPAAGERSRQVLSRGIDHYAEAARQVADSGSADEIRMALDTLALATRRLD
ncbi:MAG TPA: hypothetical protein VLC53_04250, partial [Myxococcota bacterium]|nr:hypothetical protein [Myxococcota bacterium]